MKIGGGQDGKSRINTKSHSQTLLVNNNNNNNNLV